MSQSPITEPYTLEQIIGEIKDSIKEVNQNIDTLQKDVTELKIGQSEIEGEMKALDEKLADEMQGLSKRVDNQKFTNRGILIALVVAILGSVAKLVGLVGNP